MNWKRIIGASAIVIGGVAVILLGVRSCQESNVTESIEETRNTIKEARETMEQVSKQNDALRDSVAMWRDSTEFYKRGLEDCENSKRKQSINKKKTVVTPRRDVVVIRDQDCPDNENGINIKLHDNARNNQNIVVQNECEKVAGAEIVLGNGAVNDGNIIVNNGGNVTINDNMEKVDSLRNVINSIPKVAAASSVVIIKKVKTYQRVR